MICSKCNQDFPANLSYFPRLGRSRWCRKCFANYWFTYHKPRRRVDKERQRQVIRSEMIAAYGGRCVCCAESHSEFLGIDHKNGGGNQHRKRLKRTGWRFYLWLKNQGWPQDAYQLMCHNCNIAKHHFKGCPHQL